MRSIERTFAGLSAFFSVALLLLFFGQALSAQTGANRFPNTELITQDGKRVHFYDDLIKGKIVALNFIYTSCHYACPLETARLVQVQKKLGDRVGSDIFFYSISIDPEHDTPQALKAYMEKYHVGPGWTFLTGKRADIEALEKRIGMYNDPSINEDGHMPHLLLGNDATGQWTRGNALDNPDFQARMIGEFLDNFKHTNLAAERNKPAGNGAVIANFDRGKYLYGRNCLACHTIGRGDRIGPDLLGVTKTRDPKWLARMIQTPDELLNEKDPLATALLKKYKDVRMSNIGLTNEDVKLLIGFLEQQTKAQDKGATAATAAQKAKLTESANGSTNK